MYPEVRQYVMQVMKWPSRIVGKSLQDAMKLDWLETKSVRRFLLKYFRKKVGYLHALNDISELAQERVDEYLAEVS